MRDRNLFPFYVHSALQTRGLWRMFYSLQRFGEEFRGKSFNAVPLLLDIQAIL